MKQEWGQSLPCPCTLLFLPTCSPQPVVLSRSSSCPRPWQGQLLPSGWCCSGNQKEKKVNNKDKSFDYRAAEFARHRESWGEINVAKPEFPGSTGFPANRIHTSLPTSANNAGSCQGTGERKGENHRSAKSGLFSSISDTTFKQLHSCVSGVPCPHCSHNSNQRGSSCEPISSTCVTPPGFSHTSQVAPEC